MKKIIACIAFLSLFCCTAEAQKNASKDGYTIRLKMTDMKDTLVYLAHYYGKPLPTIYKADSARLDKNGVATFTSKEKIVGGIYMFLLNNKSAYFELLLDNGDDFSVTATLDKLPMGVTFKNSPKNEQFLSYVKFLQDFGDEQKALQASLANAKAKADTTAIYDKMRAKGKELTDYRRSYAKQNPGTLLASIFGALEQPQIPEGDHFLEDGVTKDSMYAYRYYKDHYWDHFNFQDDRLVYTPIYDGRLDEYMNKLVMQLEDSVKKESDMLLAKTRGTTELFKYTLWWLTRNVEQSKIMGMDAVFVYLVENYYMKGDATWLESDVLQKYIDRAHKIAPNVIGNVAPDLKLIDVNNKDRKLSEVNAKYTMLLFWSPECGHCLEEVPKLDSVYEAVLKDKGVKVFAVRTDGDGEEWKKIIKEKNVEDWIHVYDPTNTSNFRANYDIYSTPVLYLLDERKIIRGKRIDHTNIAGLVEMLEKQEKSKK